MSDKPTPTIARIWRGRVKAERADEYASYLYEVGIRPLEEKALAVQQLREDREGESEFITISYWESIEAMSRFAGKDPTRIHNLPRDPEFLIELPKTVQILGSHRPRACSEPDAGRQCLCAADDFSKAAFCSFEASFWCLAFHCSNGSP